MGNHARRPRVYGDPRRATGAMLAREVEHIGLTGGPTRRRAPPISPRLISP